MLSLRPKKNPATVPSSAPKTRRASGTNHGYTKRDVVRRAYELWR
jgi:hypothetical protein